MYINKYLSLFFQLCSTSTFHNSHSITIYVIYIFTALLLVLILILNLFFHLIEIMQLIQHCILVIKILFKSINFLLSSRQVIWSLTLSLCLWAHAHVTIFNIILHLLQHLQRSKSITTATTRARRYLSLSTRFPAMTKWTCFSRRAGGCGLRIGITAQWNFSENTMFWNLQMQESNWQCSCQTCVSKRIYSYFLFTFSMFLLFTIRCIR